MRIISQLYNDRVHYYESELYLKSQIIKTTFKKEFFNLCARVGVLNVLFIIEKLGLNVGIEDFWSTKYIHVLLTQNLQYFLINFILLRT